MYHANTRAGGGKTYTIFDIAIRRARANQNTLICVPTLMLAEEIRSIINDKNGGRFVAIFHKEDGLEGAVTSRVRQYLNGTKNDGQILIITHQCFECLPYFSRKSKWGLFFDENISVFSTNTVNLPENHSFITGHMSLVDPGSTFARVNVSEKNDLRRIVENRNSDAIWSTIRDIGSILLNHDYDSYVNIKQFNDLVQGRKNEGQLTVYSLRNPERFYGFEKVTFLSAGFEETLAYHYWKRLGIEWISDDDIENGIFRKVHPINPNLHIYYGYEGKNSKSLRNRLEKGGNGELRERALKLMDGESYLWLENKDREETSILREGGPMLPPVCAGLNGYSDVRHAIILPAYNYDRGQSNFLSKVAWFDKTMQDRAMNMNLYQAFMRTVIRKDDIGEETRWVLACKRDAELLSARFPGSIVKPLGLTPLPERKVGRPRFYNDNEDRRDRYEQRKKEQLARCADFVDYLGPELLERVVFYNGSDIITFRSISNFVRNYRGSYFNNYFDKEPQSITMNEKKFIGLLKKMHGQIYQSKHDIPCISGALFDPKKSDEETRHTNNVTICRGLWIDIEKGDMRVKDFERLFPYIQFVAYNTLNHTKQNPRYRLYIPTDRPMYFEESVAIYHEIRYSLRAGFVQVGS